MASCDFDLRVTGIAINKAFDRSFGQGITQIGNEIKNVFTRTEEIIEPQEAYFKTPLEVRDNKIFWQNYDRSISNSMLRNAALLKLNGAPKEEIAKAKAEWKTWNQLEKKLLHLEEEQAIQFFALRGLRGNDGVSMQQVSRAGDQLMLESQLLPFNQLHQIDSFRDSIGERGTDISLPAEDEVDPAVTWIVEGPAINFQEELSEIINDIKVTPSSFAVPTWLSAMSPVKESHFNINKMNQEEDRVIATGFWFVAMKWQELEQKLRQAERKVLVGTDNKILEEEVLRNNKPARLDLVGEQKIPIRNRIRNRTSETVAPVIRMKEIKKVERKPNKRSEQGVVFKRSKEKKIVQKSVSLPAGKTEVIEWGLIPIRNGMNVPTGIIPEGRKQKKQHKELKLKIREKEVKEEMVVFEAPKKTTRINLEVTEVKRPTRSNLVSQKEENPIRNGMSQPTRREPVGLNEEIPIIHFPPLKLLPLKDIPEWVWQGTAADPNEIIDWQLLLVTMFYALLNTKILLKEKKKQKFI